MVRRRDRVRHAHINSYGQDARELLMKLDAHVGAQLVMIACEMGLAGFAADGASVIVGFSQGRPSTPP